MTSDPISQALHLLNTGTRIPDVPDEWQRTAREGLIDTFRFAITDHASEGCPVTDGECFAVSRARQIIEEAAQ